MNGLSIIIAGSGGQGILLLGSLISHSAMLEGKHVTWFPSYGAEMRGGTANCTVIVSDETIGSPIVRNADMMIIFNCPSLYKFIARLRDGGHLIHDTSLVSGDKCTEIDFEEIVSRFSTVGVSSMKIAEGIGSMRFSNMVMFGAFLRVTGLTRLSNVERSLRTVIPERHHMLIPKNLEAIERGFYSVED